MDQNTTAPTQQSIPQMPDPTQAQPSDAVQPDASAPAPLPAVDTPSTEPAADQPQAIPQPQQQVDQILTTASQSDAPQPVNVPVADDAQMTSPAPADTTDPSPQPVDTPAVDTPAAEPAADQAQTKEGDANYIEDVGNSVLELLDDIDSDEKLQQIIAGEMRLDASTVKSILTGLLDKVDQGQITKDELALLMAAPVVDDISEGGQ